MIRGIGLKDEKMRVKIPKVTASRSCYHRALLMRAQRLDRETRVWHRLKHPNILEFFGVVHNMGELFALVSPYCAQGSISGYLERYPQANRLRLVTRVPHSPHRALTFG